MENNSHMGQQSPATARNRDPILAVLEEILPPSGLVLEIASGYGEHAAYFAPRFPSLIWQSSGREPESRHSISAWIASVEQSGQGVDNLPQPLELDVHDDPWPLTAADGVVCINMVHISPWETTQALLAGAGRLLPAGGVLYLYGPYLIDGRHTAPSNQAFDMDLRRRNPEWGVRDLAHVATEATLHGLLLDRTVDMPSNNLSVIFKKTQA